ncbi:hypothetical protein EYC98_21215 [Halieaceae bacterium IMCC14734]|uniref:Uncharacterized protein n=1 Tax=Candidatus Litorirhabdus singularis TaxID=2518993 RepID=A0ABT3TM37_9GAMM|nr:hypothetical protein [Candidatus Litorirhabdus singularis]MCX2983388.1 hypothetical protein [Candidatus Litorirhabdus singularis]
MAFLQKEKTIKKFLFGFILTALLCAAPSYAQLPDEAQAIMMIVMKADGYITEEMHINFWASIAEIAKTDEDVNQFSTHLSNNLLLTQEYQFELFKSARLSEEQGEVVMTERFKVLALGVEKISPGQKVLAQEFLESAAFQRMINRRADGRSLIVTKEVIDLTMPNIESSFKRLNRLLSKDWDSSSELDYKISDGKFSTSAGLIPAGCFGQLMTELNGDNTVAAIFLNRASLRGCIASNLPYPAGDQDQITYEIVERAGNDIFKMRVCQSWVEGSMRSSCDKILVEFTERDYLMPDESRKVLSLEKIGEW